METFRSMLMICPKPPGLKFEDPPFEEEILTFIRELGYSGNIKLLSNVKVDMLPQPWRTFGTIINKCLSDQSIPRRNKVDWHMANDDPILTTMRFIPQHEVVQRYGAILPDYLTNPAMKESEAYKTYHDLATGKVQPKPKYVRRSSRTKTDEAPKPSSGKRVKATAKVAKSGKKKQPALGLETLSDIALTEAEQMKLAIERSKTQLHISQPSGSGAHEGTGKSSEEEDDDEENVSEHEDDDDDERTKSDNDGDDFVHPKFSTHNEEEGEEESFDPRVQTPSHVESTDDEDDDEEVQGVNIEGEEMDEEANNEEDEGNELYRDLNVNLEGRDVEMTDDQPTNVQTTQVTEDTHVIITPVIPEGQQQSSSVSSGFVSNMLNPRPDTGIDSIFNLNTEATSLVDVPVTTIAEPPLVFATTLPPPPTPLITHMQQTPVPTPTIVPSSSLQDLPNFGSLFGFDHRLKTLETEFSEFKQTNQFAKTVSSIPGIVDAYLANKMHEAVKTVVQLQSDKLRDEALAENEAFLNSLDDNINKIIKDQVKQQVKHKSPRFCQKLRRHHKVVRLEINPMIQPEPEDLSKDNPKLEIAVLSSCLAQNKDAKSLKTSKRYMPGRKVSASKKQKTGYPQVIGPGFLIVQKTFDRSRSSLGLHGNESRSQQLGLVHHQMNFVQTVQNSESEHAMNSQVQSWFHQCSSSSQDNTNHEKSWIYYSTINFACYGTTGVRLGINPMIQPVRRIYQRYPKLGHRVLSMIGTIYVYGIMPSKIELNTGTLHNKVLVNDVCQRITSSLMTLINEFHGPSDAMHNLLSHSGFSQQTAIRVSLNRNLSHLSRRYTRYLLTSHSEIVDIE
ncbi:hypothetical protein Tco_0161507 [Tanacetum coccineum]